MKSAAGITIWKDHEAASRATAHYVVMLCQSAIAKRGQFTIALSGGNTPKRLYQLLATNEFSRNIPWEKVFLFWGDERFVPYSDPESNYKMAKESLLDHAGIPPKNIFPVPVTGTAKTSAKEYEKTLLSFFGKKPVFDCILLGIGNDGHTASLFPGTKILEEKKKLVREVWSEEKQNWRTSFTLPLLNSAASVIFLVTGKEKAPVLPSILEKRKPLLPAGMVKPRKGTVLWIADEEAGVNI